MARQGPQNGDDRIAPYRLPSFAGFAAEQMIEEGPLWLYRP
jgi:hypothetical protein